MRALFIQVIMKATMTIFNSKAIGTLHSPRTQHSICVIISDISGNNIWFNRKGEAKLYCAFMRMHTKYASVLCAHIII